MGLEPTIISSDDSEESASDSEEMEHKGSEKSTD
jgi:hypothetical protein